MDSNAPNAAPLDLTEEQRAFQALIADLIKSDRNTAAVVVLKLTKDGTVIRFGGSVIINPPGLVERIASELAELLQARFLATVEKGANCNCPACIAKRGGVFMNPTTKAEA